MKGSTTVAAAFLTIQLGCALAASAQGREDEIVANIASGRVIVHVTKDGIAFATVEQPFEADSIPPRIVSIDARHVGVLLGAAEWVLPGRGGKPVRLERAVPRLDTGAALKQQQSSDVAPDLEMIGVGFLESLRPLAEQLHHRIELRADEPLLELVVIGYGPESYGPEVWLYEYNLEQEALRGDYLQTRVLRPRTTQLYPPGKHEPKALVEVHYPPEAKGPTLQVMVQRYDPEVARIAGSDPRYTKIVDAIQAGKANAVKFPDAADFLHALVVATAGTARFAIGKYEEMHGVDWIVPPPEPIERTREDKNRPAEAPSLIRKP